MNTPQSTTPQASDAADTENTAAMMPPEQAMLTPAASLLSSTISTTRGQVSREALLAQNIAVRRELLKSDPYYRELSVLRTTGSGAPTVTVLHNGRHYFQSTQELFRSIQAAMLASMNEDDALMLRYAAEAPSILVLHDPIRLLIYHDPMAAMVRSSVRINSEKGLSLSVIRSHAGYALPRPPNERGGRAERERHRGESSARQTNERRKKLDNSRP